MLFDPLDPDIGEYINCTTEAVYPLYSIVLVFLGNCLTWLLVLRLPAIILFNLSTKPMIFVLKWLPVVSVTFSILAGVYYFTFPYLVFFYFLFHSYSKLAILKKRRIIRKNPVRPIELKLNISDEISKSEIEKGVIKTEHVQFRATSYGFQVKS